MNNQFYILKNHGKNLFDDSRYAYGEQTQQDFNTGKAKICSGCGNYISMLEWLEPLNIKVSNMKLGDFIFGTFVGFIVSKYFKTNYENSVLTGLSNFRRVFLYYQGELLSHEYYYPDILLTNTFIDLNLVEFDDKSLCTVCQKGGSIYSKVRGVSFISPDKINNDIFFTTALGQADILVSNRFKTFVKENKFVNVEFIEALRFRWDDTPRI